MPTLQFSSLAEFVQMGSFTVHVWLVYLLFVVFVGYNLLAPRFVRRQFIREQQRRARRDAELATRAGHTSASAPRSK